MSDQETSAIGFYGCRRRAVRVAMRSGVKPINRRRLRVPCPACHHEHDVSPAWPHGASGRPDIVLDEPAGTA